MLQAILKDKKRHEVQRFHAILLEAWRGKVPFSAFKRVVQDGYKEYQPDRLLIEKKASGHSLIQELRKDSLPVKPINPDRSKKSRPHAAEIPFEQGCVWSMAWEALWMAFSMLPRMVSTHLRLGGGAGYPARS